MRRARTATASPPWPPRSLRSPPAVATTARRQAEAQSEAINEGKATGTIDVWAMGTEGESSATSRRTFEEANPDADVKVTADPVGGGARQDLQRDRRPARPRRQPDRHHLDG